MKLRIADGCPIDTQDVQLPPIELVIDEIGWLAHSNTLTMRARSGIGHDHPLVFVAALDQSLDRRMREEKETVDRCDWTSLAPMRPGFYWVCQNDTSLIWMVKVFWKGDRLFANEWGGRKISVFDPAYESVLWMGPVSPPNPPHDPGERR